MQSLGEAYDRSPDAGRDPRRTLLGAGLFALGALAVVLSILLVTTRLGGLADSVIAAKRVAGVASGLGVPAMLLGVVVVLPASTRARLGVLAGNALSLSGVWLFWHAYPANWTVGASRAFETATLFVVGTAVALWFVFSAMARIRLRNNPAGSVDLELRRRGSTKTVELSRREYRKYRDALVSDGGDTEAVIEDLLED